MRWFLALALAALIGGPVAVQAQVAQDNSTPGSLAEASSFFKAPPLSGCSIALDDLINGGSAGLRGQWILQKGPGEMSTAVGGRIEMVPLPQRSGDTLSLRFRNGRLVADSPVLGLIPISVQDRGPLKPGTGLRAESVGRGDLPDDTEVFFDEVTLGPLPCGADQLIRLILLAERPTGTGEALRQEMRLFLIDQKRMSGTYHETGPGGRMERGFITLMRR